MRRVKSCAVGGHPHTSGEYHLHPRTKRFRIRMNLTTKPISIFEQKDAVRPDFIRLPKPGESDPRTGLSRSFLNTLVWPCRENDFRPPVRSCTLRRKGTSKGVRLIDFQGLVDYINSNVEPAYRQQKSPGSRALGAFPDTAVQRVALNESFRIIVSVRVEKAAETTAAGMIARDG
jgi:hypothetical protein